MSRRIFKRERHVISFPSTRLSTRSWKGFGGNACLISIPMPSQTSPAGILHTLICVFLGYPAPMQNSEILACFCMRKYRFMTPFRDQRFNIGSAERWTPLERIWDRIKYEAAAEFKERTSSFAVIADNRDTIGQIIGPSGAMILKNPALFHDSQPLTIHRESGAGYYSVPQAGLGLHG